MVRFFSKGHSGDGCFPSSNLFKYESRVRHLFVLSWVSVRRVSLWSVVSELCTLSGMLFVIVLCCVFGC